MKKIIAIMLINMSVPLSGITKIIPIPRILGTVANNASPIEELLELNDVEAFTSETFAELLKEKEDQGLDLIIARVMTQGEAGQNVHYFEADNLNKLYGPYPFTKSRQPYTQKDPVNRLPILTIQYFRINSINNPAFTYICSDYHILIDANRTLYKDLLYKNQTSNKQLQNEAAIRVWQYVIDNPQKFKPSVVNKARMDLANKYYKKREYTKAYDLAQQIIAQPADNPEITSMAYLLLGTVLYENKGVPPDYAQAAYYFKKAILNGTEDIIARSNGRLGLIYENGGYGIEKDNAIARKYYEEVMLHSNEATDKILKRIASIDAAQEKVSNSPPAKRQKLEDKDQL